MTKEQYQKALQLRDERDHLSWEINLLKEAAKGGIIYICRKREEFPNYGVKIDGKKEAGIIGAWIEERKARVAEIEAEFNAL